VLCNKSFATVALEENIFEVSVEKKQKLIMGILTNIISTKLQIIRISYF